MNSLAAVHSRVPIRDSSHDEAVQHAFRAWKNPCKETLTVGVIMRGVLRLFTDANKRGAQ